MASAGNRMALPIILIMLALFGVVEAEAILQHDRVNEVFAGLGIVGTLLQLWFRQ